MVRRIPVTSSLGRRGGGLRRRRSRQADGFPAGMITAACTDRPFTAAMTANAG